MKNTLGLIGDLADSVGSEIQQSLKQTFVEQLILHLRQQQDPECREVAEWAF